MTLPGFYTLRFVLAGRGHDGTEFQEAQAALGLSYTGHGLDWLFVSLFVAATVFWFWRARARLTPKLVARLIVAPTRLGLVISDADRIVITNRLAPRQQRYRGFSLAISGDDARGIVKDVAFMSPARGEVTDSYFDWELRFYVGTESLAAIYLASSTFTFEGNEYFGDTGQLKALSGKLLKLTTPPGHG
jgi:hypothetical protein